MLGYSCITDSYPTTPARATRPRTGYRTLVLAHTLRTVSSPNRADTHTHTRTATKPELGRRKSKFQQRKRCRNFLWRPTLTGQAQSFALFTAAQRCQNTHHTRTQVYTQTCAQQSATKPELGRRESYSQQRKRCRILLSFRPNPNRAGETFQPKTVT